MVNYSYTSKKAVIIATGARPVLQEDLNTPAVSQPVQKHLMKSTFWESVDIHIVVEICLEVHTWSRMNSESWRNKEG